MTEGSWFDLRHDQQQAATLERVSHTCPDAYSLLFGAHLHRHFLFKYSALFTGEDL